MAIESTYCTLAEVDTYAADNGRPNWSPLSDTLKTRAIVDATKDIERYHKQYNSDGTLYLAGEENLNKACIIQAIYIGTHQSYRDIAEKIKTVSDGSYNAGGISVSKGADHRQLDPDVRLFVDRALQNQGIRTNAFFRA